MSFDDLTIVTARKKILHKEFSVFELTNYYLNRIEKLNPELNAYITICKKDALEQAEIIDKLAFSDKKLPLLGIPIALKDMYMTKGIRTTAGSKVLDNNIPTYNATVVKRLQNAGAILIGKTNQDAWGHGSSGENSDYGSVKNPWNTEYIPGGSSSGSAVSVAANMCISAGGTDTGGSIRQPASFCNVVGLKPTYGLVSRYGIIAMASSLDTVGHITKTVEDSALFLQVTAGQDKNDATSQNKRIPNYTKSLKESIKGLKIGIPKEYFLHGLNPQIQKYIKRALNVYQSIGAHLVEISLPHTKYATACYYIIMSAEVSSNLARYDGIRFGHLRTQFGNEAKRRILLGTYTLSAGYYDAYYKKAMQVRSVLKKDFENAWKKVDIIAAPISPTLPWRFGEKLDDPLSMYLSDIYTVTPSLVGVPGLAIPIGFIKTFPVGMQLIGPQFSEARLFQAGYAYEQARNWGPPTRKNF